MKAFFFFVLQCIDKSFSKSACENVFFFVFFFFRKTFSIENVRFSKSQHSIKQVLFGAFMIFIMDRGLGMMVSEQVTLKSCFFFFFFFLFSQLHS